MLERIEQLAESDVEAGYAPYRCARNVELPTCVPPRRQMSEKLYFFQKVILHGTHWASFAKPLQISPVQGGKHGIVRAWLLRSLDLESELTKAFCVIFFHKSYP